MSRFSLDILKSSANQILNSVSRLEKLYRREDRVRTELDNVYGEIKPQEENLTTNLNILREVE